MSRFKRWLLKWIARGIVTQGPSHEGDMTEYYSILVDAARQEFTEDGVCALREFLEDCHQEAMQRSLSV